MNIELTRDTYLQLDKLISGDIEFSILDRKDKIRINDKPEHTVPNVIHSFKLSKVQTHLLIQLLCRSVN